MDPQAVALMKSIHAEVRCAYGSRRMRRELHGRGHRIGLRRVERVMREHGIRARHKRRFKATTDSRHSMPVAPNLLARNFTPAAPNRVWTGDITYCCACRRSADLGSTHSNGTGRDAAIAAA